VVSGEHGVDVSLGGTFRLFGQVTAPEEWKFDVVYLKNGNAIRGLLLEDTPPRLTSACSSAAAGPPIVNARRSALGN